MERDGEGVEGWGGGGGEERDGEGWRHCKHVCVHVSWEVEVV